MLYSLWNAIFYRPLYNLLLGIISIMPRGDVGLAVLGLVPVELGTVAAARRRGAVGGAAAGTE